MNLIARSGRDDLAVVYLARTQSGKLVEMVESLQPPFTRQEKWVIIVSTLSGCPVGCKFCDAGLQYRGKLSSDEIFKQIDLLVSRRFPNRDLSSLDKFKIQLSRMGEPSYNMATIPALYQITRNYGSLKRFIPSISTIAPASQSDFFDQLLEYRLTNPEVEFQLQFSIHSTDLQYRQWLIPVPIWGLDKIAEYGEKFYIPGNRKLTLNFAVDQNSRLDPDVIYRHFSPKQFLIKITPVNPTLQAQNNNFNSLKTNEEISQTFVKTLEQMGYTVILSIGQLEENRIGSNCGQLLSSYLKQTRENNSGVSNYSEAYSYQLMPLHHQI